MFSLSHAGLTDRGRVRLENEDAWLADAELQLFVVSDGIGGHFAGELASRIIAETLPGKLRRVLKVFDDFTDPGALHAVRHAVSELSQRLREESRGQPGLDGMGATVVFAVIRDGHALVVHMGDSRAYLLRAGSLEQLTKDHSLAQLLLDNGTNTDAASHPAAGQLTRYVGMPGDALPEARLVPLVSGDRLLLSSDGLHTMVTADQIGAVLRETRDPQQTARCLIDAANTAGGRDNITVVVIDVG